jgi:hypothetical protein
VNPLRALLAALKDRRLRRIAKRRLEEILRRDGAVKIDVRRAGDGGVSLPRRPGRRA